METVTTVRRDESLIEDKVDSIINHFDSIYELELSKLIGLPLNALERAIMVSKLQSYIANSITKALLKLQSIEAEGQVEE